MILGTIGVYSVWGQGLHTRPPYAAMVKAMMVIVHSTFPHRMDTSKTNEAIFEIREIFGFAHVTLLVIIAIFFARIFKESRVGLRMRSAADDKVGARAIGGDVDRGRLVSWVVGTFFFVAASVAYSL